MKNKKGFTIVELVIVIAVIAILAAVLIPTFTTVTANARASAALQMATNTMKALLPNTTATLTKGSLFAVSNQNNNKANYYFQFSDGALSAVDVKADYVPDAKDGGTGNDYYQLFIAAKTYGKLEGEDADFTSAADKTKYQGRIQNIIASVLDKKFDKEGVVSVGSGTAVEGEDYVLGTYTYNDGTDDVVIDLHLYTSGDMSDTVVAFIN